MGNYSYVGLSLSSNGQEQLKRALMSLAMEEENSKEKLACIVDLIQESLARPEEDTGGMSYFWADDKWRSDRPEIAFFTEFMDGLNPIDFLFVRIGPEAMGYELRGCYWRNPHHMSLSMSTTFDD
jgi:hypothetical protein